MLRKRLHFAREGLEKPSFSLPYHGGAIWFEHLDSLGTNAAAAQEKLKTDLVTMAKPSSPSAIAVVLDETRVDDALCRLLADAFTSHVGHVQRLVFVGASNREKRMLNMLLNSRSPTFATAYINDLEKAKEWLIP